MGDARGHFRTTPWLANFSGQWCFGRRVLTVTSSYVRFGMKSAKKVSNQTPMGLISYVIFEEVSARFVVRFEVRYDRDRSSPIARYSALRAVPQLIKLSPPAPLVFSSLPLSLSKTARVSPYSVHPIDATIMMATGEEAVCVRGRL